MIIVFVAALDSDCRRKQFNNILDLIPLAEKLVKLTAICVACTKEAAFTRELRGYPLSTRDSKSICEPVCRNCYFSSTTHE